MVRSAQWEVLHIADSTWSASRASHFAREAGLSARQASEVAIVVSELVTNAVKYAGQGTVTLMAIDDPVAGIELRVEDRGPGISDVGAALRDGFTAGQEPEPCARTSLGCGLGAVQRLMDWITIESRDRAGLVVIARKWTRKP